MGIGEKLDFRLFFQNCRKSRFSELLVAKNSIEITAVELSAVENLIEFIIVIVLQQNRLYNIKYGRWKMAFGKED